MKHRMPSRSARVLAKGTLPIAIAAAAATFWAGPAAAAPADNGQAVPTTPSQPGVTTPADPATPPRTDGPEMLKQDPTRPSQPGVTTPSKPPVAPLPVPGKPDQPATPQPAPQDEQAPQAAQEQAAPSQEAQDEPASYEQAPQTRYEVPVLPSAPQAPVVTMPGRHVEAQATLAGGPTAPGLVANTHHFANESGYVGTVGYKTLTGTGDAGMSIDTSDANLVTLSAYTAATGGAPQHVEQTVDLTGPRQALAAGDRWVRQQPGGTAAIEAVQAVKPPVIVPDAGLPLQHADLGGTVVQWAGNLEV